MEFVGVKVYLTTTVKNWPAGEYETVEFDAEEFDTDDFHDNDTNPSRLVAPKDGYYRVEVLATIAGGELPLHAILRNGTIFKQVGESGGNGPNCPRQFSDFIYLESGDYVEFAVKMTLSYNLKGGKGMTEAAMYFLGE